MCSQSICLIRKKALAFFTLAMTITLLFSEVTIVLAGKESDLIDYSFFSVDGVSLKDLSSGTAGRGVLVYYPQKSGSERPILVVRLIKKEGAESALAEVFEPLPDQDYIPVQIDENKIRLDGPMQIALKIRSLDGWWIKDGIISYNLDVQTFGSVYSMWGAGNDPGSGSESWTALISPGELAVNIQVRDPNHDGVPDWDLRSLIPDFPGKGFQRGNYTERKCDTPVEIDPGVSPPWPYISDNEGYEQSTGQLRPPIVVDWAKGKVTYFSELVTARNQNCSYTLYTINPLNRDQFNRTNFESPFAFYDLSGEGMGYPNLILRAQRYTENDVRFSKVSRAFETIRYSWRDTVGDWRWDYKVEVLGFHPYDFETPIAGGKATIDAPSYDQFPKWVVERDWPITTFVDTENSNFRSSEGIYEWSPVQLGEGYFLGDDDSAASLAFTEIREGFRGEFRSHKDMPAKLYLSPVDNRVHLLGADGGLWNVGNDVFIRLQDLDGDSYLDAWIKERKRSSEYAGEGLETTQGEVLEAVYSMKEHLIYAGPNETEVVGATYKPALFEIYPPIDQDEWKLFKKEVEPITSQRREPNNLKDWIGQFAGERVRITGADIRDVRVANPGFRFVLDLHPGYNVSGTGLLRINGLDPGAYLVSYTDSFQIEPLTPPNLSLSLALTEGQGLSIDEPISLSAIASNAGLEDAGDLVLVLQAGRANEFAELVRKPVNVLAGIPAQLEYSWQPKEADTWELRLRLEDTSGRTLAMDHVSVDVGTGGETGVPGIIRLSSDNGWRFPAALVLVAFAVFAAILVRSVLRSLNLGDPGNG
jgi:hypothetical protein